MDHEPKGWELSMTTNHQSTRWVMIGLGFTATVINYLDRQTLSVVAPVLIDRYHMSAMTYSWIVTAFMLAYTVMNPVWGNIIDRLGTRLGYALATAAWSAAAVAHAFIRGPVSLGICRFLLGMGEGGNWPAGVKVAAEWFNAEERALATGIFNSGSAFGSVFAAPVIVWIVLKFGWRAAFAFIGGAGFLWLIGWMRIYYTPASALAPTQTRRIAPWTLLKLRFVWSFTLSKIFMDPAWYFYVFWFPEYLKQVRHFNLASIGRYAWIPFLAAGFGNFVGGWLCGAVLKWGVSLTVARKGTLTLFAFLMTAAIPAALVSNPFVSLAFVSIAMFGYNGCAAIMLAFPADVFPAASVASVFGVAALGSGFGGIVSAPLTGMLIDHYSYMPAFIVFGLIPVASISIVWTLLGPLQPLIGIEQRARGAANHSTHAEIPGV
jgi:ACS family hexuronate transporter-like MFS transporter